GRERAFRRRFRRSGPATGWNYAENSLPAAGWASIGSTPTAARGRVRPNPTAGSRSWRPTVARAPTSKTSMNIAGSGDEHSLPACRGARTAQLKLNGGGCAIEDGAAPRSDFGPSEVDRTPDCAATRFCDPRPERLISTV